MMREEWDLWIERGGKFKEVIGREKEGNINERKVI